MKIELKSGIRKLIISILVILTLSSAGLAVRWFLKQDQVQREQTVYKYNQQAQVDYQVVYLSNPFFSDTTAAPGQAYITPLVDYIETHFSYTFTSQEAANLQGDYEVTATLTGYLFKEKTGSNGEKEKVKLWQKIYSLVPPTAFSLYDSKLNINRNVPIYLREYVGFTQNVAKDLKVGADLVELAVQYKVSNQINTAGGQKSEQALAQLVIPINGNTFTVTLSPGDKKNGEITTPLMVPAPGVRTYRVVFSGITTLLALLLLLVFLKTKTRNEDELTRELEHIMKRYGDRIAAGNGSIPNINDDKVLIMESFADLVKVADELIRPILYENRQKGLHSFYVVHESLVCVYKLSTNMEDKQ